MKPVKDPIICTKCGRKDVSFFDERLVPAQWHIGTSKKMRCKDCCNDDSNGKATMCRYCCPTEHGTKWEVR